MPVVRYTGNRGDVVNIAGYTLVAGERHELDNDAVNKIREALDESQEGVSNPVEIDVQSTSTGSFSFNDSNESEEQ